VPGFPRQNGHGRRAAAAGAEAFAPDPSADAPFWAKNGSFLVYSAASARRPAFNSFLEAEAGRLAALPGFAGLDASQLGALLVGRWQSGGAAVLRAWPFSHRRRATIRLWVEPPARTTRFTFQGPDGRSAGWFCAGGCRPVRQVCHASRHFSRGSCQWEFAWPCARGGARRPPRTPEQPRESAMWRAADSRASVSRRGPHLGGVGARHSSGTRRCSKASSRQPES
jgi:hypothetical protein